MSAVETLEALLKLGMAIKTARQQAGADLASFLGSEAFAAIETQVSALVEKLTRDDLDRALDEVRAKERALLAGRSVAELPPEKLLQYSDLADVENVLVNRKVDAITTRPEALAWLVDEALPVLISTAKVVLPLLL